MCKGTRCNGKYIRITQDIYRGCKTDVCSVAGECVGFWVICWIVVFNYTILFLLLVVVETDEKDIRGRALVDMDEFIGGREAEVEQTKN